MSLNECLRQRLPDVDRLACNTINKQMSITKAQFPCNATRKYSTKRTQQMKQLLYPCVLTVESTVAVVFVACFFCVCCVRCALSV